MRKYLTLIISLAMAASVFAQEKPTAEVRQQQAPAARKIPGITTDDKFPNACVDCHKNRPDVGFDARKNIPSACISCHRARPNAPPFDNVIHLIHLTGGDSNHFLTAYQGECTNCHKLNTTTGEWKVPSNPEK